LEPGSLLAELFEGIAQLAAFRIFDQLTHVRSVHRAATYNISNFEPRVKDKLFEERCPNQEASVRRLLNFLRATAMAQLHDHITDLRVDVDLSGVQVRAYSLGLRQAGLEWTRYPIRVF
jgi:hypothetical protein